MIQRENQPGLEPACLGVVIPVFNEAATVGPCLRGVLAERCVCEVRVVDDGSSDGTAQSLAEWPSRDGRVAVLRHSVNCGKGAAIKSGLAHVTAPVVLIQDADLEYDPSDYERLLEPIRRGEADVVYGSRFASGARPVTTWWHAWGNRLLTWSANSVTGQRLTDEATCYKAFRRDVLVSLGLREQRFGFCAEVTAKLSKLRIHIVEVPIRYRGRSRAEGKKIRLWDGLETLGCILKYTLRH